MFNKSMLQSQQAYEAITEVHELPETTHICQYCLTNEVAYEGRMCDECLQGEQK